MQLILQATHVVASGDPTFFKRAFGDAREEFLDLLLRPHHCIFNRDGMSSMAAGRSLRSTRQSSGGFLLSNEANSSS